MSNNYLLLSQARGLLAPKVELPQISECACVCASAKRTGRFKYLRTFSLSFVHFKLKGKKINVFKIHLPRVSPVALVSLTCRINYSDDKLRHTHKTLEDGADCDGRTFTSSTGCFYFRLTKRELLVIFSSDTGLKAF